MQNIQHKLTNKCTAIGCNEIPLLDFTFGKTYSESLFLLSQETEIGEIHETMKNCFFSVELRSATLAYETVTESIPPPCCGEIFGSISHLFHNNPYLRSYNKYHIRCCQCTQRSQNNVHELGFSVNRGKSAGSSHILLNRDRGGGEEIMKR